MKGSFIRNIIILILIVSAGLGAILYARGYRISRDELGRNIVSGTGLLVLTSFPDGARVFVDGKLTTATDDTINLRPATYLVKIEKDGYFPWEKQIQITKEQVTETNALLFPKAPRLENLTVTGINSPAVNKARSTIAYTVGSASAELNGIYIMSLNRGIIPIGDAKRQIASNLIDNFSQSSLEISPDGTQLLATIANQATGSARIYLMNTSEFNTSPRLVTNSAEQIRQGWRDEDEKLKNQKIRSLPRKTRELVIKYFANPTLSPEGDKILYVASISASLPQAITPQIPSTNSSPEIRNVKAGDMYVYNVKDDRNYLIKAFSDSPFPELIWHPDNMHLYFIEGNKINSIEYDGHNLTTVYAGPFMNNFITPWLDGSGIIIVTSFNDPGIPPNLYKLIFR